MLDHHHCIRACRKRRSGHDFAALARADHCVRAGTGAGFANHFEDGRNCLNVLEADSKTVADGFVEWRRIGVADNVFTENAGSRFGKRNGLGRHPVRSRSFGIATDITISSPRSIGIILEISPDSDTRNTSRADRRADRSEPVIFEFQRERRPAPRDSDVAFVERMSS